MYTDPSGYRYEGNLTILWCSVRGHWGGGGGRGGITSLVLSTEMTSDDNVDRPL